jgi:hypothetical protein
LPLAALLRLAADGELTPEQGARLEAHLAAHPEDAERIEFERSLREACSRACCPGCCAPAGLRERIARAAGGDAGAEMIAERTRSRSFWAVGNLARFAAAAALVLLVASAGYLVGRAEPRLAGIESGPPNGRLLAASLARFVRGEHGRCTEGGPAIDSKFYVTEPDAVPAEFADIVGASVSLPTVALAEERGLRFVDAGLCHPPGGDAMHIRFRTDTDRLVSLWVQLDDGTLGIEDGVTYTMGEGAECIRFWRVDGVRYVLVCPDEAAVPFVSLALASPAAVRSF